MQDRTHNTYHVPAIPLIPVSLCKHIKYSIFVRLSNILVRGRQTSYILSRLAVFIDAKWTAG